MFNKLINKFCNYISVHIIICEPKQVYLYTVNHGFIGDDVIVDYCFFYTDSYDSVTCFCASINIQEMKLLSSYIIGDITEMEKFKLLRFDSSVTKMRMIDSMRSEFKSTEIIRIGRFKRHKFRYKTYM